jgi:UDP-N-acetylmuramoyl-tripeptide--D-alanyl-D-alanine ligase
MHPITIEQLQQAISGKPLHVGPPSQPIETVCTDTRTMQPRSAFIALRGENYDAHDHLAKAVAGGAVALVVERLPDAAAIPDSVAVLQVANTYKALGDLAKFVRLQMRSKVIAVAGSNGKTGTKLLIHAALRNKLRGTHSPKSFNNNVGVPLTIFPADPTADYLVLELGTNHHGEIAPLTDMSQPDIAAITNAGAEHLEGLGDLAGVCKENATIIQGLKPDGLLIVNGDDADLVAACGGFTGERVTFGFGKHNDLFADDVRCDETGVRFKLNGCDEVFIPLLGRHTASNALAAIAAGRKLGLTDAEIFQGLRDATGPDMRLQLNHIGDVHLLNDAYNANPSSMRAALETLTTLKSGKRKVAVLGEMRELGTTSPQHHREIGVLAAGSNLAWLACVGKEAKAMADGAIAAGMPAAKVMHFDTTEAAKEKIPQMVAAGDLILVKASRGIGLEKVAKAIESVAQASSL